MASAKIRPKLLILCSLSPWFKEDLPHLKESWKRYFGLVKDAAKKIKNSELIVTPNARHNISQKYYLKALMELVSSL